MHSEMHSWQILDGPIRLVLRKNNLFPALYSVQQFVLFFFFFFLYFLTVHVNVLEVSFLIQSEFPDVPSEFPDVPSESWELNHGIM